MVDEFSSIENLSQDFSNIIVQQKLIQKMRLSQFASNDKNILPINEIRRRYKEIKQKELRSREKKENEQLSLIMQEMNDLLIQKIQKYENEKLFEKKENEQEKLLYDAINQQILEHFSTSLDSMVNKKSDFVSLLVHIEILLGIDSITNEQKQHLITARNNILKIE